ncbi:hypothetical protein [Neobacillus sp.]|uniref:hypothetical protein n=1 Tax=Neobacillus sp. TaxID=2675273 RepID=UPI0035B521D4
MSATIIDNKYFVKKVIFKDEDDKICELTSLNIETHYNKTMINIDVISSYFRELPEKTFYSHTDIKKYISKDVADKLQGFNESEFYEQLNLLIG